MRILRPEDIGALVRSRRQELGLDQQTLADRLGTNRRWIWSIESGKPNVRLGLVLRAMNELNIQLSAAPKSKHAPTLPHRESITVNIDEIADMGLEVQVAPVEATPGPSRSRRKKPRR